MPEIFFVGEFSSENTKFAAENRPWSIIPSETAESKLLSNTVCAPNATSAVATSAVFASITVALVSSTDLFIVQWCHLSGRHQQVLCCCCCCCQRGTGSGVGAAVGVVVYTRSLVVVLLGCLFWPDLHSFKCRSGA